MVKVLLVTSRRPPSPPRNWPLICLTAFHGNKGALEGSLPKPCLPTHLGVKEQHTTHEMRMVLKVQPVKISL